MRVLFVRVRGVAVLVIISILLLFEQVGAGRVDVRTRRVSRGRLMGVRVVAVLMIVLFGSGLCRSAGVPPTASGRAERETKRQKNGKETGCDSVVHRVWGLSL